MTCINTYYFTFSHGSYDELADLRKLFLRTLIIIMLKLEATHQPSTKTGYFGWIQGQALILRHLDGYRLKVAKPGGAAQNTSARPNPAQHLSFIPHTNLS
ncbi:hypothetical protein D1872_294410 [compost metagenome]